MATCRWFPSPPPPSRAPERLFSGRNAVLSQRRLGVFLDTLNYAMRSTRCDFGSAPPSPGLLPAVTSVTVSPTSFHLRDATRCRLAFAEQKPRNTSAADPSRQRSGEATWKRRDETCERPRKSRRGREHPFVLSCAFCLLRASLFLFPRSFVHYTPLNGRARLFAASRRVPSQFHRARNGQDTRNASRGA